MEIPGTFVPIILTALSRAMDVAKSDATKLRTMGLESLAEVADDQFATYAQTHDEMLRLFDESRKPKELL